MHNIIKKWALSSMLCITVDPYRLLYSSYNKIPNLALVLQHTNAYAPILENYKIGMETWSSTYLFLEFCRLTKFCWTQMPNYPPSSCLFHVKHLKFHIVSCTHFCDFSSQLCLVQQKALNYIEMDQKL
jgi:hypothetical protein